MTNASFFGIRPAICFIALAAFLCCAFPSASAAEEIDPQSSKELVELHQALAAFVKFWGDQNPYASINELSSNASTTDDPTLGTQTESTAEIFGELAARYHYGIDYLGYDAKPAMLVFCKDGKNPLKVACFDFEEDGLLVLWGFWTEQVLVGPQGPADPKGIENAFWRLRSDIESARVEQVIRVLSPWILDTETSRERFVARLNDLDPDAGLDNSALLRTACPVDRTYDCNRDTFEIAEEVCADSSETSDPRCKWVDAYYGTKFAFRTRSYVDFFQDEFSTAYERSLLLADSEYARSVQLYEILKGLSPNVAGWLGLDLATVEARYDESQTAQGAALEQLVQSPSELDSVAECLGPETKSETASATVGNTGGNGERAEDDSPYDYRGCIDRLTRELALIRERTAALERVAVAKVGFLLSFRASMNSSVSQLESRFGGISAVNQKNASLLRRSVTALTRLSSIGRHVARLKNVTESRTLCSAGGEGGGVENLPQDCLFLLDVPVADRLSVRTEPLRYLKTKFSDPAIQDPGITIRPAPSLGNGFYVLANEVGLSANFQRRINSGGSPERFRVYDFGAFAHGVSATYPVYLDCDVWGDDLDRCTNAEPVSLSWKGDSRWLPLDKIEAVSRFIWDLGVSRLFDAYIPEMVSTGSTFEPKLVFNLKPSALRLNLASEVEIDLLSEDSRALQNRLDDVLVDVLSRSVREINDLIANARLIPDWVNSPEGLVVAAFGVHSISPLRLTLLAYPAGEFHLLSSYVGVIEYGTGDKKPRLAWKEGKAVFPAALSYPISLAGKPLDVQQLSVAVNELLFGANRVFESDRDVLLLSGVVDELIMELYTSTSGELSGVQSRLARQKYVDDTLAQVGSGLFELLTLRLGSLSVADARQQAAAIQKTIGRLIQAGELFSGQIPPSSGPMRQLVGNDQEIKAMLKDALESAFYLALADFAAEAWTLDCFSTTRPVTAACDMPNTLRSTIQALVRQSVKVRDENFFSSGEYGGVTRAEFEMELEAFRSAYIEALESQAGAFWVELTEDLGPAIQASGRSVIGDLPADSLPQCVLPVNKPSCDILAEWFQVLAWSMLSQKAAVGVQSAPQMPSSNGAFQTVLSSVLASYASHLSAMGELDEVFEGFSTEARTSLDGLLGDTAQIANYDLAYGTPSIDRVVRSLLRVSETSAAELVVLEDMAPLRAGDVLLGLDCLDDLQVDCRFSALDSESVQFALENSESDLSLVLREGKQVTVSLGYEYAFNYSIAPKVPGFVTPPAELFLSVSPDTDRLLDVHANVEDASRQLKSAADLIEKRASDYAMDSLAATQAYLAPLCAKTIPALSPSCGGLRELHQELFETNVHESLTQAVRSYVAEALPAEELNARCLQGLPDSGEQTFRNARQESCQVFSAEIDTLIQSDDPQALSTAAIYRVISRVFDAFAASLVRSTGDERWVAIVRSLFIIDQNALNSVRSAIRFTQAEICASLRSGDIQLPKSGANATPTCPDGMTLYDSIESAKEEVLELGVELAKPFFESYQQQLKALDSVCFEMETPGFGVEVSQTEVCGSLQDIVQHPDEFAEVISDAAISIAEDNAEALALGYLESFGVTKEGQQWCIQLDDFPRQCADDPIALVERTANLAEQQLVNEIRKRSEETLEELASPVRLALEEEAIRFCEALSDFVSTELNIFGGALTLDAAHICPSSDLKLKGELRIDSFSEKNRVIRIEGGLSVDTEKFKASVKEGRVPSAVDLSIDWAKLEFSPSVETVIQEELRLSNRYLELSKVSSSPQGLNVEFFLSPPGIDLQLPGSIGLTRNSFNLDLGRADELVISKLCREVDRYVSRSRLRPVSGIEIRGTTEQYCVTRGFRGFKLAASVEFSDPFGTQIIDVIVDLDHGVKIEPPDLGALAAAGVLAELDIDTIKLVPPVYNNDDGLTLFLEGTVDTPFGLALTAGFSVSPSRFQFNGPIGFKIPGWYDTGVLSFGDLGLFFDPEAPVIMFDGALTVVPGEVTSNLVVMKGSASLLPRDQEIRMESTLVVLRVIPMGSSVTRLSFKERLFERTVESGPLLADVIVIDGLLRIQDKRPYPFFVVNAEGDLFGADVAEMQVRLNRDFSGLFGAKLELPVVDDSADFSVSMNKSLSNPRAQGTIEINSIRPFEFDLDMLADTEAVTIGLKAEPPPLSLSITLPTFKLLTAEFLLGLIADLKLRFEIPSNIDLSNSGGERGGGSGGSGPADEAASGADTGDSTEPPSITDASYEFQPVWKPHRERYRKPKWFGIKIGYEWAYRWIEVFRNPRYAQLSRAIGVSASRAKSLNLYYADMKGSEGQAHYELLAEKKAGGRIWIFDKSTSSRVWGGTFTGDLKDFDGRVVTHKLVDGQTFIVLRFGAENLSIAKDGAVINRRQHAIPESQNQQDDNEFARYIIRESATEILWESNRATPIPIGTEDRSYLIEISGSSDTSYRYVNFNPDRSLEIATFTIRSAASAVPDERALIKNALDSSEATLHNAMRLGCEFRQSSSFRNPCGHFVVTQSGKLFALEPQDVLTRVEGFSVRSRAFAVTPTMQTFTERAYMRDGLPAGALVEHRSEALDLLLDSFLGGLSDDSELEELAIDLDGFMRMSSFSKTSARREVWSVAGDLDIDGRRYELRDATRACMREFWKPERPPGAFLAPSKEAMDKMNTNMDTAVLLGLGFAGAYEGLGFKADPLGVTFDQCGATP